MGISMPSTRAVFKVDDQLERSRLVDRHLTGMSALKDLVNLAGGTAKDILEVNCVDHAPADLHIIAPGVNDRVP